MSLALDLLFIAICLAVIGIGFFLIGHLRGEHDHGPDCRGCRCLDRLFRVR